MNSFTNYPIHPDIDLARISETYVEFANFFGKSRPDWLTYWIGAHLLPRAHHAVCLDQSKPAQAERLAALKRDKEPILLFLQAARASHDRSAARKWALRISQIDVEVGRISRSDGKAKPGPRSGATPKNLIAAMLVEIFLFTNKKEPSARNKKMAAALVNLLHTLGILRTPGRNPLNGTRTAFNGALSVRDKVDDPNKRKDDVLIDEIVLMRLMIRRSLEQCSKTERAPWTSPGMNGPVNVYKPKD